MDPRSQIEVALAQQAKEIASVVEEQVDTELAKLDRLIEHNDLDELDLIRERRLAQLKKAAKDREEWLGKGHGEYEELSSEKAFFESCKSTERVVCHFYRNSSERCKIVDMHLVPLAKSHVETKFVKLDAEKSPFLTGRLNITVLPTIVIFKEGTSVDRIVGFTELGNHDEFSTEMMEWRLAQKDGIFYDGNKDVLPEQRVRKPPSSSFGRNTRKKNIRGSSGRTGDGGDSGDDEVVDYLTEKLNELN